MIFTRKQKIVIVLSIILFMLIIPILLWIDYYDSIEYYNTSLGGNIARMYAYSNLTSNLYMSYWMGFSILVGIVANAYKGLNSIKFLLLSLAISPIGGFIAVILSKKSYTEEFCLRQGIKQCSECREYVDIQAKKCKYCMSTFASHKKTSKNIEKPQPEDDIKSKPVTESIKQYNKSKESVEPNKDISQLNISKFKGMSKYEIINGYIGNHQVLYDTLTTYTFSEKEIEFLSKVTSILSKQKDKTDERIISRSFIVLKNHIEELKYIDI